MNDTYFTCIQVVNITYMLWSSPIHALIWDSVLAFCFIIDSKCRFHPSDEKIIVSERRKIVSLLNGQWFERYVMTSIKTTIPKISALHTQTIVYFLT